jgi:DNA-binding NtrC family response regulator
MPGRYSLQRRRRPTELHHTAQIDVMLSDMVMPRMSGPTLAQAVVRLRPGIRVVFMTGYAGVTDLPHLQVPATLIHKPFTPDALVSSIHAALPSATAYEGVHRAQGISDVCPHEGAAVATWPRRPCP